MAMKLPSEQQFNDAARPKQQDICKGCLLNAAGNTIPPHFANRRDKYCHECVWRKGLGVRNVERARIRVVPSSIMRVGKQTCQVGIYDITAVPDTVSELAPRSLQVRKRHKVSYLGGTACAQKLDFLDARGTVLDVVPGNGDIVAVEIQEVGGMTHRSDHSVGLARVPAKHCGRGASLVVVFATSEEAQFFDGVFQRAFGVPVAGLIPGDELFVFDAKRAAFSPFCSITQRLANYNVPPCELCSKTLQKKKKRAFVDTQPVLQTPTQVDEKSQGTGKDEMERLVESMSTHDESTSPKSAATPESSPPAPDAPQTSGHLEEDVVIHTFAQTCGCCHDEHSCKKCKNDSQDAASFDPGAFFRDTASDEGMVDLPEVCNFDCISFDSAIFGHLATPHAVVSDVSKASDDDAKASDDESNGNANEHCTTVVGDVELPEHQPIQLPSDFSASYEWMDAQMFAPTTDGISNARAA